MPKCQQCGKVVKEYAYGKYCDECAKDVWDAGFESTSEHGYEIGFKDLVDKITVKRDQECMSTIGLLLRDFHPLEWKCEKCGKILVSKEESVKLGAEKTRERVAKGCSCGGRVVPTPPKSFFGAADLSGNAE